MTIKKLTNLRWRKKKMRDKKEKANRIKIFRLKNLNRIYKIKLKKKTHFYKRIKLVNFLCKLLIN